MRTHHLSEQSLLRAVLITAAIGAASVSPTLAYGAPGDTTLVSVTLTGKAHDAAVTSVSSDGRWVVFMAPTTGEALVLEPVAPGWQSYARDTVGLKTWRVGVGLRGEAPNAPVDWPKVSADGRYAAFRSRATNLVAGVQDGLQHVFVQDLVTGLTDVVSVSSEELLSNGDSSYVAPSADGRFVAFASSGSNLVEGDTNGQEDIFLRDRLLGTTERISVRSSGGQANAASSGGSVSQDGRYVSFASYASNLVSGDTNGAADGFVRDRELGLTERISIGPNGEQVASGEVFRDSVVLSASGRYVVFESGARLTAGDADNYDDVYLRDRELKTTELISGPHPVSGQRSHSSRPSISDDGRYVAFNSLGAFDPADYYNFDVYVKDRLTGVFTQACVTSAGETTYGSDCRYAMISGNGRYVAFTDWSYQLLTPEQAGPDMGENVFLHELKPVVVNFTVNPGKLAFGNQALYTNTSLSFWLTNKGTSALPIASVGLVGINPGMFSVNNRCGTLVAAGSGCRIGVTFRPRSIGEKSAQLRVVAGGVVRTLNVAGRGVVSAFAVSPTSLDFGSVLVNSTTAAKVATITNTGSAALPISSITLGGWNPYQFGQTHNCPTNLAVAASCTINVVFKPTATGSKTALVNITPGGGAPTRSVALAGASRRH